jgi:hypothetical protein
MTKNNHQLISNKNKRKANNIQVMNTQNTNLEVLKKSLENLKSRYASQVKSENKFAVQNKEYVLGLLKQVA